MAIAFDRVLVRRDHQAHHQPDDLPRSEVIARLGVRVLVELSDDVLENVAHVVRRQPVQVTHRGEPPNDLVQELGLMQAGDLVVELEPVGDQRDVRRESRDVHIQVLRHMVRVGGDRVEVQL